MKLNIIPISLLMLLCLGCGYKSPGTTPAQPGVMPAINQLAPDSANAGDPGFPLTVNGANFAADAVVNFNGAKMTTTFVSANQIMATVPATSVAAAGTFPVTVTNPGTPASGPYGGGTLDETSPAMNFTVN